MKRLALLLGSLLVVSAAASAKEVVPAPVVVEEAPVQIIEKEVIVYRDRAPEWRPTGSFDINETFYGKTEGDTDKKSKSDRMTVNKPKKDQKPVHWNGGNQFLRTQAEAGINLTEKAKLDLRFRGYQSVHTGDKYNNSGDKFRARFFYNHGTLGDSKVTAKSRLKYNKEGQGRGDQTVEYGLDFDFADYIYSNDYVKTTKFVVGPVVSRTWGDGMWTNDKDGKEFDKAKFGYVDSVGLYFNWTTALPYGFGTDLEIDSMAYQVGNKKGVFTSNKVVDEKIETKAEKSKFVVPVKFLLTHEAELYANDDFAVTTWFEGGFDTYNYSNRAGKATSKVAVSKESYSAYILPEVKLTYHVNKFVDVYGLVGAEYRNFVLQNKTEAANWRWQPYARLGLSAKF